MMEGDFCEESPFENSVSLSKLQMLQVFIMTLTIVPLRLLCCGVLMCITVFVAYVAGLVAPKDNDAPRSTLERVALDLCTQMILLAHLILGLRVTTLGTPAAAHQAPIWVMAPHTSFFDVLPCTTLRPTPSVVAKSEALRTPVLGVWLRLTRFIAVARDSEGARRDARLQLQQRAQLLATQRADGSWPQVLIFPEATCHNRKSLLQFYTGAFVPGVPVQPVCVHWPRDNWSDFVSYVFEGPGSLVGGGLFGGDVTAERRYGSEGLVCTMW